MPISEIYTGTGTTTASLTASTTSPLCQLVAPATKRAWVVGVRIGIGATSVSGGSSLFQLFTMSANGTGATTTGFYPNDPAGPTTSLVIWRYTTTGTFTASPTGTTNCLWQQELPNTTGSSWEEFPPLGYEYGLGVSGAVGLWVTNNGTSASQSYYYELVWSE